MFICSCNALTDRDIEDAALACDGTVVDCYRQVGAKPVCGNCLENAQELIDKVKVNQSARRGDLLARPKVQAVPT